MIKEFHIGIPIVTCYKPEGLCSNTRELLDVFCEQLRKIAVGEGVPLEDIRVWVQILGSSGYSDAKYVEDIIFSNEGYRTNGYEITPHTFVLSQVDLEEISVQGAREYEHLRYLLPTPGVRGDEAERWFATHEATHMIDAIVNGGVSVWAHDENFEKEYSRLLDTYIH